MFKQKINGFLLVCALLLSVFSLAACSAPQSTLAAQPTRASAPDNADPASNSGRSAAFNLPTEEKLAAGLYLLEKTAAPITSQQAKVLVPLWQQIQLLTTDTNSTQEQIQAVYLKIENTLTADQMKSVEAVTFADMQSVMSILGIQMPAGIGANGGGAPNGGQNGQTQDQRATRAAEVQTRTAGTPNPGGTSGAPRFQGTPGAGFNNRRGGMGSVFIEPLIQFLQERAAN